MEITPKILFGKVMHKRFFLKVNVFTYGIYYLALPLSKIGELPLPVDRFGLLSFYRKDHASRDGKNLQEWIEPALQARGISLDGNIVLIAMPRVLGYVFNPVSFWLCLDRENNLRAVMCEVNNTFGESHSYLCAHEDGRVITNEDELYGEKFFHVSPFLEREGYYRFRFQTGDNIFGAWIDHYNAEKRLQLQTALTGRLVPMTKSALNRAFWRYPLVTLKAIILIHFQAVKLLAKGVRYIPKPLQNAEKTSQANITKM